MTEELKKTIKEELSRVPNEGQEAIAAVDWVKIAEEIGQKYSLNEEEIESLQLETLLVLIGVTDSEYYAANIENQVGTTTEKAASISSDAFQKIFVPIRATLEQNIKNKLKTRAPTWRQSIDFILSGGDYGSFVESRSSNYNEGK